MPADTNAKREWIERVLGKSLPRAPSPQTLQASPEVFAKAWREALIGWRDASDDVDQQITSLQRALRESGDGELEEIAEYGLNGVTGGFKVKLLAVLRQSGAAGPDAKLASRALGIVNGFRAHLDADLRVLACDENPFGVPMSLQATLGGALARLDSALRLVPHS